MAARYLKSLTTGVVLPYSEAALKTADIRLMEPSECAEYEASLGISREEAVPAAEPNIEHVELTPPPAPAPEPKPEPVAEESVFEDEDIMAALKVD